MKDTVTILFTLDTPCKEQYSDTNGTTHTDRKVHIVWDSDYKGIILKIENTPGSWFMSTLLGNRYGSDKTREGAILPIHGMNQLCLNISDLLKEAVDKLEDREIVIIPDNI